MKDREARMIIKQLEDKVDFLRAIFLEQGIVAPKKNQGDPWLIEIEGINTDDWWR